MSLIKKWFSKILVRKSASIIASLVLIIATFNANCTCVAPFYEPEQPEELKRLRNNY